MKRIWLVLGVTLLAIAAFFAGWFLSRPILFGGPDGMAFRGEGPVDGFMELEGSGEAFTGTITAIEAGQVTVASETDKFDFRVTSSTGMIDLGETDGLQIGDAVDIVYEAQNGELIALTITSTN
jgi:hypothetical protein